jgi:hypothetical protein
MRGSSGFGYESRVAASLDAWANHLEEHLEIERMIEFARLGA